MVQARRVCQRDYADAGIAGLSHSRVAFLALYCRAAGYLNATIFGIPHLDFGTRCVTVADYFACHVVRLGV